MFEHMINVGCRFCGEGVGGDFRKVFKGNGDWYCKATCYRCYKIWMIDKKACLFTTKVELTARQKKIAKRKEKTQLDILGNPLPYAGTCWGIWNGVARNNGSRDQGVD